MYIYYACKIVLISKLEYVSYSISGDKIRVLCVFD